MIADRYCELISDDLRWRERELRDADAMLLKSKGRASINYAIMTTYAHWEGHFRTCATQLLLFISEGIRRKLFKWTDLKDSIRHRIVFCSYRRASIANSSAETFLEHLDCLSNSRFTKYLDNIESIIMTDSNHNSQRAEAICKNLGLDASWFLLKKIIIDERLVLFRNAIAHGDKRLRSGEALDYDAAQIEETLSTIRALIRETRNRFENCILNRAFLIEKNPIV